jgi:undecaprenyl-diphosphatase
VTFVPRLIGRLSEQDRGLYDRWSLRDDSALSRRRAWKVVTHIGGASVTVGAVLVPLWLAPWPRALSWRAALCLAVSHVIVQIIKRLVGRPRPAVPFGVACPDRFSFPSGHATSSLAVGLAYGVGYPPLAAPLIGLGLLVGWSRVALGVHYPGDVLAGQIIAAVTVLVVTLLG